LDLAKDFVVFRRWDVFVMQSSNDRTIRVRKLLFPEGVERHIIAQDGA
jgi:hypothetical protein